MAAPVWQSKSSTKQSNGTSLVITKPTGVVDGDLLLLELSCSSNVNIQDPAGWNIINKHGTCTNGSSCTGQNVYWKTASSEPASYTFTTDATNTWDGTMWRINGQDPNSPIDAWSVLDGTGQTWTNNGVTTVNANTLICYFGTSIDNAVTSVASPTQLGGFTNRTPKSDSLTNIDGSTATFVGPGATGTISAVASGSSSTTTRYVAHVIAITGPVSGAPLLGASTTDVPTPSALRPAKKAAIDPAVLGWLLAPLSNDAGGASPVSNTIDVPTIDKRHSQIVFQGYTFIGVPIDNNPNFVMPFPHTALPPTRVRPGHQYQGFQSQPIKFEYDMAGQWVEPAKGFGKFWKHSFEGKAVTQFFLDAPPESYGKNRTELPPMGPKALWMRTAQYLWTPAATNNNTGAAKNAKTYLPLLFVGSNNAAVVSLIQAKGFTTDTPFTTRQQMYRGFDFKGAQWWMIPDSPIAPYVMTALPVRGRRRDYSGFQHWFISDSPSVPFVFTALPPTNPGLRRDYRGWLWWSGEAQPAISLNLASMPVLASNRRVLQGHQSNPVRADSGILTRQSVTPLHAYSTRKLLDSYSGNCIKVRRDSDNTTQDIGFTGDGLLDSAALASFCGSGSGFVDTWYDQSGNGNNLTQATTSAQPRVYNSGTQDKFNGQPSIFFDGSAMYIRTTSGALTAPYTQMHVVQYLNAGNTNFPSMVGSGLNTNCTHYSHSSGGVTGSADFNCGSDNSYFAPVSNNTYHALAGMANGASSRTYHNGTSATGNSGSTTWTGVTVGGRGAGSNLFNGMVPEMITFNSDITDTTIKNIQANQKTFWGTT